MDAEWRDALTATEQRILAVVRESNDVLRNELTDEIRSLDEKFTGEIRSLDEKFSTALRDEILGVRTLLEEVDGRVRAVAEGVATVVDMLTRRLADQTSDIDLRLGPLEGLVRNHSRLLQDHEDRIAALEQTSSPSGRD